jgi:hypothetical protein
MSITNAPLGRDDAIGVYVNGYFIVWGGLNCANVGGGKYNVAGNSWSSISSTGAPTAYTSDFSSFYPVVGNECFGTYPHTPSNT